MLLELKVKVKSVCVCLCFSFSFSLSLFLSHFLSFFLSVSLISCIYANLVVGALCPVCVCVSVSVCQCVSVCVCADFGVAAKVIDRLNPAVETHHIVARVVHRPVFTESTICMVHLPRSLHRACHGGMCWGFSNCLWLSQVLAGAGECLGMSL